MIKRIEKYSDAKPSEVTDVLLDLCDREKGEILKIDVLEWKVAHVCFLPKMWMRYGQKQKSGGIRQAGGRIKGVNRKTDSTSWKI